MGFSQNKENEPPLSSVRRSLTKDRCSSGESVQRSLTKDRCSSGESVSERARKLGRERMLSLESFSATESLEKVLMMKKVARDSVSFTESLKRSELRPSP